MGRPLIVIVGPTASGKSSVAMDIAKRFDGEIICADSRTIYKDLDIGTVKPSVQDQAQVPHHGIDLVSPGERFTAYDFKNYALQKIEEIRSRGNMPILVGGTGLYVDSVIFDYAFSSADLELRSKLEHMDDKAIVEYCKINNIIVHGEVQNRRHVINSILRAGQQVTKREEPIANTIIVGIATDKAVLRERIHQRSTELFNSGMVEEAVQAAQKFSWDNEAMTGNIYKLVKEFVAGTITHNELQEKFETADWQLAKRQLTWLKRNPYITWLPLQQATSFISKAIA